MRPIIRSLNSRGIERDLFPRCASRSPAHGVFHSAARMAGDNRPHARADQCSSRYSAAAVARLRCPRGNVTQFPAGSQHVRTPWPFTHAHHAGTRHSTRPFRDHPGPTSQLRTIAVLVPLAIPFGTVRCHAPIEYRTARPQLPLVVACAFIRAARLDWAGGVGRSPSRVMHGVPHFLHRHYRHIRRPGSDTSCTSRISGVEPPVGQAASAYAGRAPLGPFL